MTQLNKLEHRGPDEKGFYFSKDIRLGCCRLAIVDEALNKQPLILNKTYIIFNGEIYNFLSLRNKLISKGVFFKTNGDTEVILQLYKIYGEKFVYKLNGMFSIAIWDDNIKTLLLYRDRMGQKPLFYRSQNDSIYFSSEMKSFLPLSKNDSVNFTQINSVLTIGYVNSDETVLNSVRSLSPGSYLKWKNGTFKITKYWDINLDFQRKSDLVSAKLLDLLENSVRITSQSERKLAVILSGGIDSTIIAFLIKHLNLADVNTFTLSVSDSKFDETEYADTVAKKLNSNHRVIRFDKDPNELEKFLSNYLDQPFADSSIYLSYQITKAMKKLNFVVGLGGEGGDELFGGYSKYVKFMKQQKLIKSLKYLPMKVYRKNIFENNSKKKFFAYKPNLYQYYILWNTLIDNNLINEIWSNEIREMINFSDIDNFYYNLWHKIDDNDILNKIMKIDQLSYLSLNLNYKTDLASSANGVEIRSPYQDNRLIDFLNSLPSNLKIQNGINKVLLKNLLINFFPEYDINRPKFGFGFNRAEIIRKEFKELIYDFLSEKSLNQVGWFNAKTVHKILKMHEAGRNFDNIIWPVFIAMFWARKWMMN